MTAGPRPAERAGPGHERFEAELAADRRAEGRLPWKQLVALALVAAIVVLRALLG